MIDPARLVRPQDPFRQAFPDLGFRQVYSFHTGGEPVLLTDPTYLADVYNSTEEAASYLRAHGVIVMDLGGDVTSPVWYAHPYVLLPISVHLADDDLEPPAGATVLAQEVGTDSGSFIFLPLTADLPPALAADVRKVLADGNGAALPLPAGRWAVYYEQWDAPQEWPAAFRRNVVLRQE